MSTSLDLDAIRARHDEWNPSLHRHEDGDTFYCCPACPDYAGPDATRECECDLSERKQRKSDIDALLAEVVGLRREIGILRRICPRCNYAFMYQSGFDRHPCPPPLGYDFSAP